MAHERGPVDIFNELRRCSGSRIDQHPGIQVNMQAERRIIKGNQVSFGTGVKGAETRRFHP
jgi:hypothetical protein